MRETWELELKKDEMSERKMTKRMASKPKLSEDGIQYMRRQPGVEDQSLSKWSTIQGEPASEDYLCEGEAATVMEKEISYLRGYED